MTKEGLILSPVMERLRTFRRSVFRLEALDSYTSDAEDEGYRRWLDGETLPARAESDYLRRVRAARAADRSWRRVHAVTRPTPYLRFEIEAYYAGNEAAGEEIAILEQPDLGSVFCREPVDFWLFDDELALEMRYDDAGRILDVVPITDPDGLARHLAMRDTALRQAVPLREYRAALRRAHMPSLAPSRVVA